MSTLYLSRNLPVAIGVNMGFKIAHVLKLKFVPMLAQKLSVLDIFQRQDNTGFFFDRDDKRTE